MTIGIESLLFFISVFLTLLGLRVLFVGPSGESMLLGDLLASVGFTFLWLLLRRK
jgi:hypothetical protein